MPEPILSPNERTFLAEARRAILATTDPVGRPRLVPVCFVLSADRATGAPVLHTPLDEKPKRANDPLRLARVLDIEARPSVTILVDRWSEDWDDLAWLRAYGDAIVLEPDDPVSTGERSSAIATLRAKYPQYVAHELEARPLIRIVLTRAVAWSPRNS